MRQARRPIQKSLFRVTSLIQGLCQNIPTQQGKGRGGGFKTFAQTLEELNHKDRIMDIFKIDCEGCEWSSHKDWIGHGMRQILIETHGVPTPRGTPKARWYQRPMNVVEDYWKDFADNGYALYSRDPNGELGMELAFMKLTDDFWKDDS